MAISSTPPPQAYTREVLAQAFNWLKSQPASVRERAMSADALVSLYLHAKRYGTTVTTWEPEPESSASAFKTDLKNLAQGFKDFEIAKNEAKSESVKEEPLPPAPTIQQPLIPQPQFQSQFVSPTTAMATTQTVQTVTTTQVQAPVPTKDFTEDLDAKTLEVLREVQRRLNLSSEMEALRVLVLLGFEKIKPLLPL